MVVLSVGAVASPAALAASGGTTAGTLPPEGVFENCPLDADMQTCVERLQAMRQGGMQVVVIPAWAESLNSLRAYAADAGSLGMSVMWELSNPTWWRTPATSTGSSNPFTAFAQACGCSENDALLSFTVGWLAQLPGTYGYYAADDSMLAPGDQSGVAWYVSQIKRADPVHTVMIGSYNPQQSSTYQGIADVIGTEIYPVTTASLTPVTAANQSTWDLIGQAVAQAQQAADAAGKQSAFILQAFTWGDNTDDGEAVGTCSDRDTAESCYDRLTYPTAGDQLQLRNEVLLHAHAQLILWWSFPGTYGQAGLDTYSIYPTGPDAAARWSGLAAAVGAPFPSSAQPKAVAAAKTPPPPPPRNGPANLAPEHLVRDARLTHPVRLVRQLRRAPVRHATRLRRR